MFHRRALKVGVTGFLIAVLGALSGFSGVEFNIKWLSVAGFTMVVIGVVVGFAGILYGWFTEGRHALSSSVDAAKELSKKVRGQA